ncbi:hypothetical protein [Ferruginibacter sp.]
MIKQLGNVLLIGVQKISGALLRIVLFFLGWCFKLISRVADKIGDEILKFAGK